MREIRMCSEYALKIFNSDAEQIVRFTEKLERGEFNDGTTNEEVVNMLIERFYSLNKKSFSVENQIIISHLKDVRRQLVRRLGRKIGNVKRYNEEINY
jgi:hypothetical protein